MQKCVSFQFHRRLWDVLLRLRLRPKIPRKRDLKPSRSPAPASLGEESLVIRD